MEIRRIFSSNCSEWSESLEDNYLEEDVLEELTSIIKEEAKDKDWDGNSNGD